MEEQKKEWTGVWIPKSVWLNEELGWTEKMLLVEIKSLDNKDGCFASNEHFAKFFKLSKDRISKMITNLNRMDYLTVKLIYKEGTKQVEKRIIRVNILKYEGKGENTDRYGQKILEGMGENADRGIGENAVDNNTSINNTININNPVTSEEVTNGKQSNNQLIKEQAMRVYEFYIGLTNSKIKPSDANLKEVIGRLKAKELTEENCYEILKFKYAQAVKQDNFQYFTLISLFRKSNAANTMQQIELMEVNKPMSQEFKQPYKQANKDEIDWSRA